MARIYNAATPTIVSLGLDPRAARRPCRIGRVPRVEPEGDAVVGGTNSALSALEFSPDISLASTANLVERPMPQSFSPDLPRKLAAGIESGLLRHLHAVLIGHNGELALRNLLYRP
ncbi:hypothetical protein N8D56_15775 [Devosia sp. A8/3-2]|nr:hypothetical protein N8D56_15775 [Devosia sp. A8/3-2]